MITLESGTYGWDYVIVHDDGRELVIQSDWDYAGVASTFGWSHEHGATDGTIDCPDCGMTAGELLAEAQAYLDDHIGDSVSDPGYFDGE